MSKKKQKGYHRELDLELEWQDARRAAVGMVGHCKTCILAMTLLGHSDKRKQTNSEMASSLLFNCMSLLKEPLSCEPHSSLLMSVLQTVGMGSCHCTWNLSENVAWFLQNYSEKGTK